MKRRKSRWWTLGAGMLALTLACAGPTKEEEPVPSEVTPTEVEEAVPPTQAADVKSYKELEFAPLREFQPPEIRRKVLSNGMILFTLEDHELPLIQARAVIRTGSVYEPPEKVGLASITGTVMRTGGTTSRTGDELDETLEEIAASVETGIGRASGSASLSCLEEDFDQVLEIFADVLMDPAFPEDKIDLAKVQARSEISRRNDSSGTIVNRELMKLIYGAESPYARTTEYVTIGAIERDDLVAFHETYYHPDRVTLGVWGDIDPDEVRAKVEAAFADWKKSGTEPPPPPPQLTPSSGPSVNTIRKADVNQTNIRIGHQGIRRDNPDFYAVTVMNRILGLGFGCRLFDTVRSKMGLAYVVGSFLRIPFYREGMFALYCQTKSESTHAAITAIFEETDRIREEEVTDAELKRAKESILNSFVFNFDTSGEVIGRRMDYEYYGYPADLLEQYRKGIAAVTKEDVLEAAKKHIRPEEFTILAVGRPEDFDQPLDSFGEVNEIDITIPAPPQEAFPEATVTATEKGLSLMAESAAAHGGEEALGEIGSYVATGGFRRPSPTGQVVEWSGTISVRFPMKVRKDLQHPMGEVVQAFDGEAGWVQIGGQTRPLPENALGEIRASMFRDPIAILAGFRKPGVQVQHLGETPDGKADRVLIRNEEGASVKASIDTESKRLVGLAYTASVARSGPEEVEETLSDFREVSGFILPFSRSITITDSGRVVQEVSVEEIEINADLADDIFRNPEELPDEEEPPEEEPAEEAPPAPPEELDG